VEAPVTADERLLVTQPGVYDISAGDYHADPVPAGSLSSSGARRLLPPSCPAIYRWERDNKPTTTKAFDIGHAAHKVVLGTGPDIVRIDAAEWRSNAVKAEVAAVREAGGVPLKPDDFDQVWAMAAALRQHPVAAALFNPDTGWAERSLFWVDQPTGVWRRALLDWLPGHEGSERVIFADYKTCRCASPDELRRSMADYGYAQQAAWYLDGAKALGLAERAAFVFVCQEKTPPYLVTVAEPDATSMQRAQHLNRRAIDIYADCVAHDRWPGYSDEVELIPLPGWLEHAYLTEIAS
jgi:hypothetical protein